MNKIKRLLELHKAAPSKYMFKAEWYSEIAPAADFYSAVYDELPKLIADLEAARKEIDDGSAFMVKTADELVMARRENKKLKADLEAARKEIAVLNRMIEAMATCLDTEPAVGCFDSCPAFRTQECEFVGESCKRTMIKAFRAEAEKGE